MTTENSAKVLDFNAYRARRVKSTDAAPVQAETMTTVPMMMWYPVWVMVPQNFPHS